MTKAANKLIEPHKYKFKYGDNVSIDWIKARSNVRIGGTLKILYPMGAVGFAGGGCCLHSYAVENEHGEIFAADEYVLVKAPVAPQEQDKPNG